MTTVKPNSSIPRQAGGRQTVPTAKGNSARRCTAPYPLAEKTPLGLSFSVSVPGMLAGEPSFWPLEKKKKTKETCLSILGVALSPKLTAVIKKTQLMFTEHLVHTRHCSK